MGWKYIIIPIFILIYILLGKSTLIKLLTGEVLPDSGDVWKHPNLRVAYVAQHAFHHVEQHLDKTPNEYIRWRYQYGEDRELLAKAARQMTPEDQKQLDKVLNIEGEKRVIVIWKAASQELL
jgi:elongation factor 3